MEWPTRDNRILNLSDPGIETSIELAFADWIEQKHPCTPGAQVHDAATGCRDVPGGCSCTVAGSIFV